jgi:hypothetical protein
MDGDLSDHALADVEGGVADDLGAGAKMDQPPQGDGIAGVGGRAQHPRLKPGFEVVDLNFEVADLLGELGVVEQDAAVCEIDRQLREVLHVDDGVDGAFEIVDGRRLDDRRLVTLAG